MINKKINLPIGLAILLAILLLGAARYTHQASARDSLRISESPIDPRDRNYTNIVISGKTLIIKAAEGYSPIINNSGEKPLIILERNATQKSAHHFDEIIVNGETAL